MKDKKLKKWIGILLLFPTYLTYLILFSPTISSIIVDFIIIPLFFLILKIIGFILLYRNYKKKLNKLSIILYFISMSFITLFSIFSILFLNSMGLEEIGIASTILMLGSIIFRISSIYLYSRIVKKNTTIAIVIIYFLILLISIIFILNF